MGDGGGGHWLVRMEWRSAGWSVCLPLLISPCTIKSRSSLLAPAHPGGPGKRAVKWLWWCGGALFTFLPWRPTPEWFSQQKSKCRKCFLWWKTGPRMCVCVCLVRNLDNFTSLEQPSLFVVSRHFCLSVVTSVGVKLFYVLWCCIKCILPPCQLECDSLSHTWM